MPETSKMMSGGIVYRPTSNQVAFHESKARFRIVCAGKRSGKTFSSTQEVAEYCFRNRNKRVWWVSLSLEVADRGWDTFFELFPEGSPEYNKRVDHLKKSPPRRIYFKSGSILTYKTAAEAKGLVGQGLDLLVVDEAAFIPDEVWYRFLRPNLTDRNGRAIIISTPEYKNWCYDLYQRGLTDKPEDKSYEAFHWLTLDNIFIDGIEDEIHEARNDLSAEEFKNLFEASFLDQDSSVFTGIKECLYRPRDGLHRVGNRWFVEERAQKGKERKYTIGVDVAKGTGQRNDFTVILVCKYVKGDTKLEKKVVYLERMKESSLVIQSQRIYDVWQRFGRCKIYVDAGGGIGSALIDDMQRSPNAISMHLIEGVNFNNKNKTEMIGRLRADIEHQRVKIPNEMDVLIEELSVYSQVFNPKTGNVFYSAPGRKHDDTVIALALATIREDTDKLRYLGRVARIKLGF